MFSEKSLKSTPLPLFGRPPSPLLPWSAFPEKACSRDHPEKSIHLYSLPPSGTGCDLLWVQAMTRWLGCLPAWVLLAAVSLAAEPAADAPAPDPEALLPKTQGPPAEFVPLDSKPWSPAL